MKNTHHLLGLLLLLGLVAAVLGTDQAGHHSSEEEEEEHSGEHDREGVKDMDRACPEGFFYAGEPDPPVKPSRYYMEKGETSPTYSCYKFIKKEYNFAEASLKCKEGNLVTVDNYLEDQILNGPKFRKQMNHTGPFFTSGLCMGNDSWTWMATGEYVSDNITVDLTIPELAATQCLYIKWTNSSLEYGPIACSHKMEHHLCEVRVYTQTWYVWFVGNWLQILFFLALAMLLLTSCCLVQSWSKSAASRRPEAASGFSEVTDLPPSYSEVEPSAAQTQRQRYAQKGKEILAKVVFYKPKDEEKQKLATSA